MKINRATTCLSDFAFQAAVVRGALLATARGNRHAGPEGFNAALTKDVLILKTVAGWVEADAMPSLDPSAC